jgi:magnesium-transporting ATPase (P-type)
LQATPSPQALLQRIDRPLLPSASKANTMKRPSSSPDMQTRFWHNESVEATLQALDSSWAGLSSAHSAARLQQHGPNAMPNASDRSVMRMLIDQFSDFMVIVLVIAAVISGIVGDLSDTIAIVVIIALNAIIGFVQEWRAETAMAALRALAAPLARVRRDGSPTTIDAADLVPGDIVLVEAGNVVPADLRLIECVQLRIAESALTGESQAVDKHTRKTCPTERCPSAIEPTWRGRERSWPTAEVAASSSLPVPPRNSVESRRSSQARRSRKRRCSAG